MTIMENNKEVKLEERIMAEIKSGHIRLRSKYIFLAEKLGLGGGLTLSVLSAVFFLNLAMFYIKSSGYLAYLSLGSGGALAFLESFPYLWVIGFIAFMILAACLLKKYDVSYKRSFVYITAALIIFVVSGGSIMAWSGVNKVLEERVDDGRKESFILKPFYGRKDMEQRFGVVGKVEEIKDGNLIVSTPHGIKAIRINDDMDDIEEGDYIVAAGRDRGEGFHARSIKPMDEKRAFMLKQRINNLPPGLRHGQPMRQMPPLLPEMK